MTRNAGAEQFITDLGEAAKTGASMSEGEKTRRSRREFFFLRNEPLGVYGTELRPGDGVDEAGRAEVRIAEDVIDKDAYGAGEIVERIVESYDGSGLEKAREAVEVSFCACVGVIAIDPQEADGALPVPGDVGGESAMNFNVLLDVGRTQ